MVKSLGAFCLGQTLVWPQEITHINAEVRKYSLCIYQALRAPNTEARGLESRNYYSTRTWTLAFPGSFAH